MNIQKFKNLSIFFGDAGSCPVSHKSPDFPSYLHKLTDQFKTPNFILQRQTHSSKGLFVSKQNLGFQLWQTEGDFAVTNQLETSLAVLTADCLPIIFFDEKNNALSVIHAGWRGSVAGIAQVALEMLQEKVGTKPESLNVFFGPAAHVCCYEVQPSFQENLKDCLFHDQVMIERNQKLYFDNLKYNELLLSALGVKRENIDQKKSECTMCVPGHHSFRRQGQLAKRQLTCAWLGEF